MPCDDSVSRVVAGLESPVRRSRGHAPLPLDLPFEAPAVAGGRRRPEEHLLPRRGPAGLAVRPRRRHGRPRHPRRLQPAPCEHLERLTGVSPVALVADRHPAYRSRTVGAARTPTAGRPRGPAPPRARRLDDGRARGAVAGDRVLGVAFDGTGYGDDGAAWGGEFLVADYAAYARFSPPRLRRRCPAATPASATRAGWRCPTCAAPGCPGTTGCPASAACRRRRAGPAASGSSRPGCACVPTSSMGRLFDAVASIAGIRHRVGYDAQAAMELESLARAADAPTAATGSASTATDRRPRARSSPRRSSDVLAGAEPGSSPPGSSRAVVDLVVAVLGRMREETGLDPGDPQRRGVPQRRAHRGLRRALDRRGLRGAPAPPGPAQRRRARPRPDRGARAPHQLVRQAAPGAAGTGDSHVPSGPGTGPGDHRDATARGSRRSTSAG